MAFNYQTLKKFTNEAIVADGVTTADIGNLEVKTGKIAPNAITSVQIGTGAVDMASNTVSGTLPGSQGGSGITSIGSSTQVLRTTSGGSSLEWADSFGA